MKIARIVAVIAVIFMAWTFSPYLEYLGDRPTQSTFNAHQKMGLFRSDRDIDLLISIDAEKGLRVFDVQVKRIGTPIPLTWRLSPANGKTFDVTKSDGTVVGTLDYSDTDLIVLQSKSMRAPMAFGRRQDAPYRQHLIEFENDGVVNAATVFVPNVPGPTVGVVMVHGSGRSDRNNLWYVGQADYLARQGFTVLLPDKRGSGRSGGLWKTASMQDLADDTNAAVRALSNMDDVSLSHIGLMGLSMGGHIVPLAAATNQNVAFVVNVVGSLTTFNESLDHESLNLFRGHTPDVMIPPLVFLASQIARMRIPLWWFKNGSFDVKPYWEDLDVPGLIIWGGHDEFENVSVVRSLEMLAVINADRDVPIDLKVYPEMGHGLFDEDGRISKDYLSFVAEWMAQAGNAE